MTNKRYAIVAKGSVPWNKGLKGAQKHSEETRAKLSAVMIERWRNPEQRTKMSAAKRGKNNPFFGKTHTVETKTKISASLMGRTLSEDHLDKMKNQTHSEETRAKISATMNRPEIKAKLSMSMMEQWRNPEHRAKMSGENNGRWKNGASFKPYCPLFNHIKKEEIRNRDERRCQLCGKSEILEGRRLSVHHINSDKMQGCHGKKWVLVALCRSCNSKSDTVEKEFLIVSNLNLRWVA